MNLRLKEFNVDGYLSYKIIELKKCCDAIMNYSFIDLTSSMDFAPSIGISQGIEITDSETSWYDVEHESIRFCPFCGEEIFLSIDEQEDVTECYNELQSQETKTRKKSREVDSKKKEAEYLELASAYSDELNFYLTNDSIHMFIE